jgi:hypothetical protein
MPPRAKDYWTKNIRLISPTNIALGSLCGVLSLTTIYELSAPLPKLSESVVVSRERQVVTEAALIPAFQPPSSDAFSEINTRPVFSPRRAPIRSDVSNTKDASAPPPPPASALIGVIIEGETRLAILKSAASPLETSVTLGAIVDGWQVTVIDSDRIVVRRGSQEQEIRLDANRANSTGPTTQAIQGSLSSPASSAETPEPTPSRAPNSGASTQAGTQQ